MLIDRQYYERWGSMATSKSEMAELVTQLVMNSLPNDGSRYDIPIGSSTFYRGWDGYVESVGAHHFIPEGFLLFLNCYSFSTISKSISRNSST